MKDLSQHSGPWAGWSIQDGLRITESLELRFSGGVVEGTGCDKDGDFQITGSYDSARNIVRLTRRYTWTTEPSQEGVGIPYEYNGTWDGAVVSGRWNPRTSPWYGGPFEMWPIEADEYSLESLEVSEVSIGHGSGKRPSVPH